MSTRGVGRMRGDLRPDSPESIALRKAHWARFEALRKAMDERYPVITPENAAEVLSFQTQWLSETNGTRGGMHTCAKCGPECECGEWEAK